MQTVILTAGSRLRLKQEIPKILLEINNKTLLEYDEPKYNVLLIIFCLLAIFPI